MMRITRRDTLAGAGLMLLAACGAALIEAGQRVLFTRTTDLVQKLQAARRDLSLPATLTKLDRFDCLILDDLGYVRKDQAETSVLFELIAERYERRSLITTCNQPFSTWDQIFPDPAMTVAAIDRLVHHATILELNTESYRRRTAAAAKSAMREFGEREFISASHAFLLMVLCRLRLRIMVRGPPAWHVANGPGAQMNSTRAPTRATCQGRRKRSMTAVSPESSRIASRPIWA